MAPATTDGEKLKFRTLNRQTGHRVVIRYVDPFTGKVVKEDDEAPGFDRGEDDYVLFEDEDLDSVALDSTHMIDIETLVDPDSIGLIWRYKPYFCCPAISLEPKRLPSFARLWRPPKDWASRGWCWRAVSAR